MPPQPIRRRGLLRLTCGSLAATAVTSCSRHSRRPPSGTTRHRYGRLHDQFGDLYLPSASPKGTIVLLHGGFWLAQYDLDLMVPMGKVLQRAGWAVWNLEYRRLEDGGGYPATFTDAAAGIDRLRTLDGVDLRHVVLLGHSAGGQLAVWAASRTDATPGGASKVAISGCISLAGVLDLAGGARANVGNGAIQQLMGGTAQQQPGRYRLGDPVSLAPASCPVACLRGRDDHTVPEQQTTDYVQAAKAAGGTVTYDVVPGDHFTIIDPKQQAWATTVRRLDALRG